MIALLIETRNINEASTSQGRVKDISFEMLTLAHQISQKHNYPIIALVLSNNCQPIVDEIKQYCHEIICVEDNCLENFNTQIYQPILHQIISEIKPTITMIGHSGFGTDLATLLVRRQMYGGKIIAEVISKMLPAMITVRAGSFEKITASPLANLNLSAKVTKKPFTLDQTIFEKSKFLGYGEVPTTGIDITKADVIVAIGRGIKEQKNIPLIEQFANEIGGTLACTRPIIDAGWLPKDRQVGSSGKTVKPKLYIALGISGAFQHISGMKNSETIIAVNKDPEAPIFSVAHYGVVGDVLKIMPVLANKIKELKG
ncbi:MAG: electron transfer flavoprotein subunit alpha/FixB family protein [candidate division WOR-3 bacterium]